MVDDKQLDPAMMSLLKDRILDNYGDVPFDVVDFVPVLWSGWECDSTAVLVRYEDGGHQLLIADAVGVPDDVVEALQERLATYKEIGKRTEPLLAQFASAPKRGQQYAP